jgi:DNA polymerase elongation subunit (family B)
MIVDTLYDGGIVGRYRDEENNRVVMGDTGFKDYFFTNHDWAMNCKHWSDEWRREFPNAKIHDEIYTSVDGVPLAKVVCDHPYDKTRMKKYFPKTWEGDIPFADRWMIDNMHEQPNWNPRKCWFDIEWNPDDNNDFTTCWAGHDSYTGYSTCFAWREGQEEYETLTRNNYRLHIYTCEEELHAGVIDYIVSHDFDMLIAHAAMWADIPHMVKRFKNIKHISPYGEVRKVREGNDGYRHDDQPIVGRLVFDTAARAGDGTGFERVWMDSGNGQFPSRKLNEIGVHLGLGEKDDIDLTNDWRENFFRYCDYCVRDVELMRDIDVYLHATDFFMNMVRFCGVSFTSTFEVGKFARGLVNRRTELKFPSRAKDRRRERGSVQGATVMSPTPGLHNGVAVLDFKGLYPSIMLGDNLCWTTYREEPTATTRTLSNGTHWCQVNKGILPRIVEYLFEERQELKRQGNRILEKAVKRVMASLYGLVNETLGHGMADERIGATITAQGRYSLDVLRAKCEAIGHPVLFGHTDSCFILCSKDDVGKVAHAVTDVIQDATGNKKLFAEAEAWMPLWFCGDVKNRYAGLIDWPVEDAGKLKVSGFEMKHSSTPPLIRHIQKQVLMGVVQGDTEEQTTTFVKSNMEALRNGNVPVESISIITRLSKDIEPAPAYKHNPDKHYPINAGGYAKAARFANWYNGGQFKKGDSVRWVYVSNNMLTTHDTDVVAYDDPKDLDAFEIDIEGVINKLVRKKLRLIYDVLKWDLNKALDKHQPKTYW